MKNNKINKIEFNNKKNQSLLIEYIYRNNKDNIPFINIKDEIIKYTTESILLNNKEISRIKSKVVGKLKDLTLTQCLEKIIHNEFSLEIMSKDLKYNIKLNSKNRNVERSEKIIIFGNKNRLNSISKNEYKEFFLDITFKIIPKCFRPYKLITLAALDEKNNRTVLLYFILFIYMDWITYLNIFKYLNELYKLNPSIIHTDYEKSLEIAIKKSDFFSEKIIHIKCFFHFFKSIREHLKKTQKYKCYLYK